MTLHELLFILLFLSSVIAVIGVLVLVRTGRRSTAWRTLRSAGAVWCVYLVLLGISDLMVHPLVVSPGQDHCFDEMCFALVNARTLSLPKETTTGRRLYVLTIRVTSHSRGRAQSEGGIRARLYDHGQYFVTSTHAQAKYESEHGKSPLLTQRLAPGESSDSVLVFDVPQTVTHPGLTLDHGFTLGYFVFAESPFFHEPDIFTLPSDEPL